MAKEKVSAKVGGKDGKPVKGPYEVEYDFGDSNLQGLVKRFGDEVVFSRAKAALVIDLQALMRREIDGKDFDPKKLQEKVNGWTPSVVSTVRRSASERMEDTVAKMTPEQQADLLKKLQAQIAAQGQPQGKASGKTAQAAR